MTNEEKYKLALFGVIRNSMVMPNLMLLGKSMEEINVVSVLTVKKVMEQFDYELLKASYEEGKQVTE